MTSTRVRNALVFGTSIALVALAACSSDGPSESSVTSDSPVVTETAPTAPPPSTSVPLVVTTTSAATTTTAAEPEQEIEARVYDFSAVSPIVQAFVDDRGLDGASLIVVHRDDGVIDEEQWGEFSEDRISLIASSSKMMTAGVLLRLQDDGLLDLDAPVADLVEWGAGNPDITIAQLLSNSSGLVGLLPNPAYGPYICQYIAAGTLQECGAAIFSTPDDDVDVIAGDTDFRYGGAQWQVAGAVAEVVSGKSWAELIDEIYVQPCELEALAFNNHFTQLTGESFTYPVGFDGDPSTLEATQNPNMEGGAYITPSDYAQLLLMHLRGGMCGDTQVLSQSALDQMHADRIGATYDGDAYDSNTGYGMGWWVDRTTGRISDGGAYGTVPWLDLDDGYGAYLVVEADSATGNDLARELYDIVEAAVLSASGG